MLCRRDLHNNDHRQGKDARATYALECAEYNPNGDHSASAIDIELKDKNDIDQALDRFAHKGDLETWWLASELLTETAAFGQSPLQPAHMR